MDKISKQILNKLKNSNDFSIRFSGIDNFFDDIASESVIKVSLDYLKENNYICIEENMFNSCISLSYRALHPIQYHTGKVFSYLLDNWIAIIALVISIIALIKQ